MPKFLLLAMRLAKSKNHCGQVRKMRLSIMLLNESRSDLDCPVNRLKNVTNFQSVFVCLGLGLGLKMALRAFEGLLSGVFDSEVAYLTYDQ